MLTFPVPAALHGDALTDELQAAGFTDADVYVAGDDLVVSGVDDAARADVQAVIDAHVPPGPPVEATSRRRLRELKDKGWQNLTATEKQEVAQRVLEALA